MAARDVLKNINLFVDGRGYAGQLESVTPPKLAQTVQEWRAGGMQGPIDIPMGMEKMEGGFSLIAYDRDVLALFGVATTAQVAFTIRGSLESFDGTVTPVAHFMRGRIKEMDSGDQKPGDLNPLKCSLSVSYYRLEHGGQVVHEIDLENMVHVVNGVDQLAAQRAALGI